MGLFDRLKEGLTKTRRGFTEKIEQLVTGYATIDDEFFDDLEAVLLAADVGVKTTGRLLDDIRRAIKAKEINTPADITPYLRQRLAVLLAEGAAPPAEAAQAPTVIMVVGVNGVGKTTTIAKLGHYYREQGRKVILGAADTFRAAAIDQLEIWGERIGAEVVRHKEGSDPAAVAFDAVQAAKARGADLLIIDTAGRLHTKSNLMEELKKVQRVIARELPGAPHEVLLVLDATTGQNALSQARLFKEAVQITGLVLTKLDGTAKGGVIIAVKSELDVPVKWIGVGEKMDDLRPFVPEDFAAALFGENKIS